MGSDDETTSSSQSADGEAASSQQPKSNSETRKGDDKVDSAEIRHAVALAAEAASKAFGWDKLEQKGTKTSKKAGPGNELSKLIPGYTAPMRLEAKSLKGISGASLAELRNRASRGDSTTFNPSISILGKPEAAFDPAVAARKIKTPSSIAIQKNSGGRPGKIPTSFSSSFKKKATKKHDNTAGSGWFGMNPTAMTDQLKTDLSIIRNRNYLDPKKFYKSADSFQGKVLQVGTVIEGSSEFYSSRLAKRDRRQNLTEEIMADSSVSTYAKRKYSNLQAERARPNRKPSKRGRQRR